MGEKSLLLQFVREYTQMDRDRVGNDRSRWACQCGGCELWKWVRAVRRGEKLGLVVVGWSGCDGDLDEWSGSLDGWSSCCGGSWFGCLDGWYGRSGGLNGWDGVRWVYLELILILISCYSFFFFIKLEKLKKNVSFNEKKTNKDVMNNTRKRWKWIIPKIFY